MFEAPTVGAYLKKNDDLPETHTIESTKRTINHTRKEKTKKKIANVKTMTDTTVKIVAENPEGKIVM